MGDEGIGEFFKRQGGIDALVPAIEPVVKELIQYPIRLSPHTPYVTGKAALVFVLPHVLDPHADVAEFGWGIEGYNSYGGIEWEHGPPYEAARVVGWFRPSFAGDKYNVEFSCLGQPGHSFVLESVGAKETVEITTETEYPQTLPFFPLEDAVVGTTFTVPDLKWRWFSLSNDGHWKLLSFAVDKLSGS